jgi:hypothetical protein
VSDVFSFCTGRNRANWTGRFRGDGFMGFFISSSSGEEGTNRTLMLMVVRGGETSGLPFECARFMFLLPRGHSLLNSETMSSGHG